MIDAQELRRRWTDRTNAVFGPGDRHDYREFSAENYEREFDFRGCRSIVFLHGQRTGRETDVLLLAQGSGHMTLPAGVQVLVQSGYAKWVPAASAGAAGGSTVVGTGVRAPPPSRASGYARSSAGSAYYSGSASATTRRLSPPRDARDAAPFGRRGPGGSSYMSACGVPLPPSDAGRRSIAGSSGDWEVVEQMDGYSAALGGGGRGDDDDCSIAPSESISSVGSRRGGASHYSRRYTHDY